MKIYKQVIIAFFLFIVLGIPWLLNAYPGSTKMIDKVFSFVDRNFAAIFLHEKITVNQLKDKYNLSETGKGKIRVLIMPGHEPNYGGAEYGNLKEREMNVELAKYLQEFLKNNEHYEVIMARDDNFWNSSLQSYFNEHWNEIITFFKDKKSEMSRLMDNGVVAKITNGPYHNKAKQDVALRLYGINKWVNENNVDIAIHIHFNDYPRKNTSIPGEYTGFTIYVPEQQYSNSTTTQAIANTIFKRLSKYNAVSNLPREDAGVVQEQDLIAIGSYNTVDAPSMLIEYGYIYEPQFSDQNVRKNTFKDLAFQTYLGIQDFFDGENDVSLVYDTLMLPYLWNENISKDISKKEDVLALQTVLLIEGLYPGNGRTKNECPRTGKFGPCTMNSLNSFQNKYNIKNEKNMVGEQTKKVLNELYSVQIK